MASVVKAGLSGISSGSGAGLTASTTVATIHVVPTTALLYDEVWIYAANTTTASVNLTVGWPGANITVSVPGSQGLLLVVPGLVATSTSTITATAAANSSINVFGFVNRIQQ